MPKRGEYVGSYLLLTDLRPVDAGTSVWGFAERNGQQYFIKQHTSPKYPLDGQPGSAAGKEKRRRACEAFETRKRRMKEELEAVSASGGALVCVVDLLRQGAHYYTVTEKVDTDGLKAADVARLPLVDRLRVLSSASRALEALHRRGIVHADIKTPNILVQRRGDSVQARLIDFDAAFLEAEVPSPDDLPSDPAWASPEAIAYIKGEVVPGVPDRALDVFSLGLAFCEYLTGSRVPRTSEDSPGGAVRAGETLLIPRVEGLHPDLHSMLNTMLGADPRGRPTLLALRTSIDREIARGRYAEVEGPSDRRGPEAGAGSRSTGEEARRSGERRSRLRGTLAEKSETATTSGASSTEEPASAPPGRLRLPARCVAGDSADGAAAPAAP